MDCLKVPLYWADTFREMPAEDVGRLFDLLMFYACNGYAPEPIPEDIKEPFSMFKRDIDYQRDHPHSYRYPTDEKAAIRRSKDYNEWRSAVFERDDYTCQSCGQKGGILNAHHILHFADHPEERLNLDNGITLCKDCHMAVHRGEIVLD